MNSYLPFLVIGITVGSIYGIAAMGLVLSYKTSGVLNVGHGAVAAMAAVCFHQLRQEHGMAWPLAAAISVLGFGVVAGLLMEQLARALAGVPTAQKLVATVGLVVAVPALVALLFGSSAKRFDPLLTQETAFTISGVNVTTENVVVVVFGAASAIALYVFFNRSRLGRAMRGVVDDPDLLGLTGVGPARVRRMAWLIGCSFAAVSGILLASAQQQLDVVFLSLLVVQAFGAAAIGAFTNLPLAYAGGLAIGVLQAVLSKEAGAHSWMQGLDVNTPFLVLFVVLLVLPKRKLVELGRQVRGRARTKSRPAWQQLAGWAMAAGAAVLAPTYWGVHQSSYTVAATQVLLFLSLVLLVRISGQISLCQVGFAAIGGAMVGQLLDNGLPWPLAVACAVLIALPVGAVIAIPAIRLSGLYLGLATLGFGILLAQYAYSKDWFFGTQGQATRRPEGFVGDTAYYYLVLAVCAVALVGVAVLERSRLGRLLRGMADSPVALSTLGVSVNVTRTLVFCVSAGLAALSGALGACVFGSVSADSYNYLNSLLILAVLSLAGAGTLSAAFVAPVLSVIPLVYLDGENAAQWLQLAFGLAAILTAADVPRRLAAVLARGAQASTYRLDQGGPIGGRLAPVPTPVRELVSQ
ncbi:MAG: branched-chain amino acid ABC transporter permease [Sporichthyaceae bacterium]